jgi:hypothetical protein
MRDFVDGIVVPFCIMILVVMLLFGLGVAMFCPLWWITAKNEALLYNQKYKTQYTTSQFFWAGETIKSFLNEGKQTTQNINFNGAIPLKIEERLQTESEGV